MLKQKIYCGFRDCPHHFEHSSGKKIRLTNVCTLSITQNPISRTLENCRNAMATHHEIGKLLSYFNLLVGKPDEKEI